MNNAPPPDDDKPKQDDVVQFPEHFNAEHVAAQKRLAAQLIGQMPADPREQRAVVRYLNELIDWQEKQNGGGAQEKS